MLFSKKMLLAVIVSLSTLSIATTSQAREFGEIYTQCGLGAMIFKKTPVVAAISNITWDLGTTAILSNASSEDQCQGSQVASAAFIHKSYASLEHDIAKGEGKHLNALMDIASCSNTSRAGVVTKVRADFATTAAKKGFATSSPYNKSKALYDIMQTKKVKSACRT
ncbi:MAG: DUF3015 family protein [Cocleimonas sp.]|nr:DUF3015 family protein [Cocleimonas sp.]